LPVDVGRQRVTIELGPTKRTIKSHRQRIMEKMNVRSLAELVVLAERLGLSAVAAPPACPPAVL